MNTLIGMLSAVLSGILNGSFAVPMKRNVKWEWENTWFLYAVSAMILYPGLILLLAYPELWGIYRDTPDRILWQTFLLGAGWGIGSLTFGLGLHLLGFSLGYTIIMGIIAVAGSLVPMCVHNPQMIFSRPGLVILAAMAAAILGVFFCGQAGQIRQGSGSARGSSFRVGLVVCIASGILSAMLNLAFDFGAPIAQIARDHLGETASSFQVNNAIWFLALPGGFVPYLVYCGALFVRRGTASRYVQGQVGGHWGRSFLMGILWFGCIMLYGAGASHMGDLGTTVAWLVLMAVTVVVGNLWGILSGEWRGADPRAVKKMTWGTLLLLGSVIIVGLSKLI